LEELSAEAILTAQEAVSASLGAAARRRDADAIATLLSGGISLPWAPYVDGEVVTEEPLTAAASPRHRNVPLLAGATAHEFNMAWLAADWITAAIAADGLAQAGVPAPAVAAYADRAGSPPSQVVGQAVTDRVFRVPAQQLAAAKAAAGGSAFTYDFRWTAPAGPLPGLAFHCIDVPFFFDALAETGVTEAVGPEPPPDLAARAHGALVRFVTDGDPGWESFRDHRSPVMIFAEPSGVRENPLKLERTAWTR
jgi:para-nitrobenzyl esterase